MNGKQRPHPLRRATETLTPFELDRGESFAFALADGTSHCIELVDTGAGITFTTLPERGVEYANARTFYRFHCVLRGSHDHSHFVFNVRRDGVDYLLDPWILFWQMYQDRVAGLVEWGADQLRKGAGHLPGL